MVDLSKIQTLDCQNVGGGLGVFANNNGSVNEILGFKTLIGGPGIVLNSDDQTITIEYVGMGNGGAIPFSKIVGTPERIAPLGLLYGTPDNRLDFVSSPTRPGTVLGYNGTGFVWQDPPTGTVSSVGLLGSERISVSGGPVTAAGEFALDLMPSGVRAGVYQGNSSISVDTYGRVVDVAPAAAASDQITNAGSGQPLLEDFKLRSLVARGAVTISADANQVYIGANAVTSVDLTSDSLEIVGNPITSSGCFSVEMKKTGVQAGTYSGATILVDEYGRISAAMSSQVETVTARSAGGGVDIFARKEGAELQFKTLRANGGVCLTENDDLITISADVGLTHIVLQGEGIELSRDLLNATSPSTVLSLTSICERAGTYARPSLTVGSDGRISNISEGEADPLVSVIGGAGIIVEDGPAYRVGLQPTGILAGKYSVGSVTLDDFGRVIATEEPVPSKKQSITIQGDATGSGCTEQPILVELAESGASAGTYVNPTLTVDSKGRITAINSGQPIEGTQDRPSGVAAGSYDNPSLTIDASGRITHASTNQSSALPRGGKAGEHLVLTLTGPAWAAPHKKIIPPDLPSANSWQLLITCLDRSGLMGIRDIEFRSEVGGPSLGMIGHVLCTDPGWGEHKPENAFRRDGSWYVSTSQFNPNGLTTIGFQFDQTVVVREFAITAGEANTCGPTKIELQYLYGTEWQRAWSVTTQAWDSTSTRVFSISGAPADESFRTLSDTPSSFINQALSTLRVRQDETGLEFVRTPPRAGQTHERPDYHDGDDIGRMFFDLSLGIPVWWTGTIWVSASGEQT